MKYFSLVFLFFVGSIYAGTSEQQIKTAFPTSNYQSNDYILSSPNSDIFSPTDNSEQINNTTNYEVARELVSPLTADEIRRLRLYFEETRREKSSKGINTVPRISSLSVDLSASDSLPILRTLPGEMSTVLFIDSTGAAWPIAAPPRLSDNRAFDAEWLAGSSAVIISAKSYIESANLTVFLEGLPTPVIIKLASGEDTQQTSRIVDYRLDIRVPGRGPNAKAPILGENKIALYDEVLQSFLDGVSVKNATKIEYTGSPSFPVQIWKFEDSLYIRTRLNIHTAYDQTLSSGDGMRVYKIPVTPFVSFSDSHANITLKLNI